MMGRNFDITKRLDAIVEKLREVLARNAAADRGPEGVWLNSADVRFLFRITARSLDQWKKDKLLLPLRLGGRNYFRLAAVIHLIESHRSIGPVGGSGLRGSLKGYRLQEVPSDQEADLRDRALKLEDLVLLDPNDYCAYLNISSRTEFRHRRKGLLPHIRIRGRIYYTLADILEMLERNKKGYRLEAAVEVHDARGFPQMDADLSADLRR